MSRDSNVRLIPACILPISFCAKCNRRFFVEDMHCLPEIQGYARSMAKFMMGTGPEPSAVDDNALKRKYGYGFGSVFCKDCLNEVVAQAKG